MRTVLYVVVRKTEGRTCIQKKYVRPRMLKKVKEPIKQETIEVLGRQLLPVNDCNIGG